MGGEIGGELASKLTVHAINESLQRLSWMIPAFDRLVAAIEQANYIVRYESQRNHAYKGMSATATVVLVEADRAYIAEVGDSRAYLIRKERITQLTTDQSLVEILLAKGVLTAEQAAHHPRRNVVLQAVGLNEVLQVAVGQLHLQQGDYLMLCSDGLSNNVLENEMLQIITNSASLSNACKDLVALANQRGGKDNITVALSHFTGKGLPQTSPRELTRAEIETLANYDPERSPEKTHKRTMLLSDPSICVLQTDGPTLENLHNYPHSSYIDAQNQKLRVQLNETLAQLDHHQQEILKALKWVANQNARYARMDDLDSKMASAREHIEHAWRNLREVVTEFRPKH